MPLIQLMTGFSPFQVDGFHPTCPRTREGAIYLRPKSVEDVTDGELAHILKKRPDMKKFIVVAPSKKVRKPAPKASVKAKAPEPKPAPKPEPEPEPKKVESKAVQKESPKVEAKKSEPKKEASQPTSSSEKKEDK